MKTPARFMRIVLAIAMALFFMGDAARAETGPEKFLKYLSRMHVSIGAHTRQDAVDTSFNGLAYMNGPDYAISVSAQTLKELINGRLKESGFKLASLNIGYGESTFRIDYEGLFPTDVMDFNIVSHLEGNLGFVVSASKDVPNEVIVGLVVDKVEYTVDKASVAFAGTEIPDLGLAEKTVDFLVDKFVQSAKFALTRVTLSVPTLIARDLDLTQKSKKEKTVVYSVVPEKLPIRINLGTIAAVDRKSVV